MKYIIKPPRLALIVKHAKAVKALKIAKAPQVEHDFVIDLSVIAEPAQKRCDTCNKLRNRSEYHRRKKGEEARSSRCKYCAAAALRRLRTHNSVAHKQELEKWSKAPIEPWDETYPRSGVVAPSVMPEKWENKDRVSNREGWDGSSK